MPRTTKAELEKLVVAARSSVMVLEGEGYSGSNLSLKLALVPYEHISPDQPELWHQYAFRLERWAFTPSELLNPKDCRNYDEFVAMPSSYEVGIMVQRNGHCTPRWADGTLGVTEEDKEAVDMEETYHNAFRPDILADTWRDVYTDGEGRFVQFAE